MSRPVLLFLFALPVLAAASEKPDNPEVRGKPLDDWIKQLRKCDLSERQQTAMAISSAGAKPKKAIPNLKKALEEDDKRVRQAAADALKAIEPERPKKAARDG